MLKLINERFFSWMSYEPVVGLMMIIAAMVLFITKYRSYGTPKKEGFWDWARRIIESLCMALILLGLLWAFRSILNNTARNFQNTHGRVSSVNYASVKKIWGSPHVQKELSIVHTIEKEFIEEIPREDPAKPPLYKKVIRSVIVDQNSIVGSKGEIELTINKRKKGSAYYSGFDSKFFMEYDIINDSDLVTLAGFNFPLLSKQMAYENFKILENGKDLSPVLRFSSGVISWKKNMKPHEKLKITVQYATRGLEYYYYQIPNPREIKNFSMKMTIDRLPVDEINYPEGCLTPKKISPTKNGAGSVLEWSFDRAITTAGMGVALTAPEQPGADVALVLKNSPYALMLLIVSVCLTFLILGGGLNFLEIALLSAAYSVQSIAMASLGDYFFGFWGSMLFGAALALGLTYLLYRNLQPELLKKIIFSLVGFFTVVYPLSGLVPDFHDTFRGIVVIGLIVYLFFISLYARLKPGL